MDINEFIDLAKSRPLTNVYIVGAGTYGQIFGRYFDKHQIAWEGYVDRNSRQGPIHGKKVISYREAGNEDAYYIISSYIYRDEMMKELIDCGVREDRLVLYETKDTIYECYEDTVHWKGYTEKLKRYEGLYKGNRCFIIGNGPSLTIGDLEKLKGEITFACNSIYALYEHTSWRPDFHCAWDEVFCKKMMSEKEDVERMTSNCEAFFTRIMSEGFAFRDCKDIRNLYYVKDVRGRDGKQGLPLFSGDCSRQVYSSGSVTYMMLQLAVYMGFEEIYLLGMDCSYSIERHSDGSITRNDIRDYNHLIQQMEERQGMALPEEVRKHFGIFTEIDAIMDGYRAAKQYADLHGIRICNATRGGKLEIFPRADLDKVI